MNQTELFQLVDSTLLQHSRFNHALSRVRQLFRAMEKNVDPICLPILGEARTGKSRLLEQFLREAPSKREEDGLIVPFLRIRVPSKPSVKNLAETLLFQLGDPWYSRGTEATRTGRLREMLQAAHTRVIALDEFQHFEDKASLKIQHEVADWLKVLVDEERIGLIVTGLPSCMRVIEQNEQLSGRLLAPVSLRRFEWTRIADRKDFMAILAALEEALHPFKFPLLSDTEIAFRLYCASGGLIGYLMKILKQATLDALDEGTLKVPMVSLEMAYSSAVIPDPDPERRMPNPFTKAFDQHDQEHLLFLAGLVGTHRPPPRVKTSRPRKKSTSSEVFGR